jgi:hypothetical protein
MEKNLETDIIEGLKLGKEEAFQYIPVFDTLILSDW